VTTPTLPVHALYSHLGTAIATSLGSAWRRSGRHPESLDELVSNPETTRLWSLAVVASSWADDGAARQRVPSVARAETQVRLSYLRRVRAADGAVADYVAGLQDEQTAILAVLGVSRAVAGYGPIQALLWQGTPTRAPVVTDAAATVMRVDLDFVAVHTIPLVTSP
jgi:hypothetical protein